MPKVARASRPCDSCDRHTGETPVPLRRARVKEYWIVLAPVRRVEVYRQPENGRYRESLQFGADDTLQCASIPAMRIPISDLFA